MNGSGLVTLIWLATAALWVFGIGLVFWYLRAIQGIARGVDDIARTVRRLADAAESRGAG